MLKAKTKEITMASQNRKNCIEAKRVQSLNEQTSGEGVAEIGDYSLVGKEFSFACDWFREQCKFFSKKM